VLRRRDPPTPAVSSEIARTVLRLRWRGTQDALSLIADAANSRAQPFVIEVRSEEETSMKRAISIATASLTAVFLTLTLTVAAQDFNKSDRTIMTFSSAVELPNLRLEPGSYVFMLEGVQGVRNIVKVLSQDEQEVLGQFLYVPAERKEVSGDTIVTFRETSAGATPAVQFWYYPGELIGKEFIYPKDQALRIAQRTGATVQTEDGPVTADDGLAADNQITAPSATVQAEGQIAASQPPAPAEASVEAQGSAVVSGSGLPEQPVETESVGTSGAADAMPAQSSASGASQQESTFAASELPRTGSPLPLSGLIGLLSLLGVAGIRAFRL
jgi:hypothetical protein